ncbi:MAG TPA: glycosyltransferase family 87 protein [Candidatus Dormibacteraeota bacterium]|nr:glycosyltransferase family 87 protein [Candidatus Dormibacteraeota bacterium]
MSGPGLGVVAASAKATARVVWPALLIGGSLYVMAIDLLHMPGGRRPGQMWAGVDFHTYLAAALVGLQHGWAEIYDQGLIRAVQGQLNPQQFTQPYLSPPADSWLALPLVDLPYALAFAIWASIVVAALALAFGWTSAYRGPARVAAVAVAMTPWWVLLAVYVGQVVPLVAAAVLVTWRLVKSNREIAAGLVLSLLALKPNTAILVPLVLLVTGRWRAFVAWAAGSVALAALSLLVIGPEGVTDYVYSLGHLPGGGTALTLGGAFGVSGITATVVRAAIVVTAVGAAFMLRTRPGVGMAVGVLGSLLISPYLHNSDLCLFVVAGWMVWQEAPLWRAALVAMLLAASPYLLARDLGPSLQGWVRIELAFMLGLAATAVITRGVAGRVTDEEGALTPRAEFGRRAPA